MKSIVIIQTILPHYRESFFELIAQSEDFEVTVIAGKNEAIAKSFQPKSKNISDQLLNRKLKIGSNTFVFQSGLFRLLLWKKPDHIVFGGPDIHVISSLLIAIFLKLFTNTKIHWWTHGLNEKNKWLRKTQCFFLSFSKGVLTYETAGKRAIIKQLKWDDRRVSVLKNAINTQDYGFNKSTTLPNVIAVDNTIRLLFTGRMTKAKRCDILIKAIAILNQKGLNCITNVVGKGETFEECVVLSQQLNIQNKVNFIGELYGDKLHRIFSESDLFILPGKVGLSVVHALSYGLPVITTAEPIHSPEIAILKEGNNGGFFEGLSPENLADKILEWAELLKTRPDEIKANAKQSVRQAGYTPKVMRDRFLDHFKQFP